MQSRVFVESRLDFVLLSMQLWYNFPQRIRICILISSTDGHINLAPVSLSLVITPLIRRLGGTQLRVWKKSQNSKIKIHWLKMQQRLTHKFNTLKMCLHLFAFNLRECQTRGHQALKRCDEMGFVRVSMQIFKIHPPTEQETVRYNIQYFTMNLREKYFL